MSCRKKLPESQTKQYIVQPSGLSLKERVPMDWQSKAIRTDMLRHETSHMLLWTTKPIYGGLMLGSEEMQQKVISALG